MGPNFPSPMPPVTSFSFAQMMGVEYQSASPTSTNSLLALTAGLPFAAHRKVAIWALVQVCSGPNSVAVTPVVMPFSTAHRTADNWAYGFAELSAEHRRKIETYQYISNPGCHATGFISLVYPLVKMGILPADAYLTCHSITGYSGGGKKMIAQYEAEERDFALFSPRQYGLGLNHKHLPEMKKQSCIDHEPIFNPVVADFPRGMATTVPLHLGQLTKAYTAGDIRKAYAEFYAGQQLIEIMPEGQPEGGFLETNAVVDSNLLQIFVFGEGERLEVVSRFDNLGKGASGAAVQNMNICLGLDETIGI